MTDTATMRRMQLMHAAMEVFGEKGYAGTRMDEIAKRVGIGKSTVYEYFKSKDDLFLACGTYYVEQMAQNTADIFAQSGTLRARIEQYERYSMGMLMQMQGNLSQIEHTTEMMQIAQQCMRESIHKVREVVFSAICEGQNNGELSPDCDVETFTILIMRLAQMVCNPVMGMPIARDNEQTMQGLLDFIYKAATK